MRLDQTDARPQTPRMTIKTRIVTEDEADIRLDRWLRRHIPGLQQSLIQKLCRTGQIRVDGARADTSARLLAGQSVRIPPMDAPAEPKPV
ncbi:MAG: rRNA pseudouridine synthase, partial [Acetobacteraceae bacterium]|nr:rRNA pseudouridine synthase [Acetobacteraceae bacterium]